MRLGHMVQTRTVQQALSLDLYDKAQCTQNSCAQSLLLGTSHAANNLKRQLYQSQLKKFTGSCCHVQDGKLNRTSYRHA